jgi:Na+/H+-dicarboxylate symporter
MLALVFGIALRPDKEAIRPAYVVVNSFAEAMMRLTRIATIMGAALLVILSANWFASIDTSGILMANLWYFIGLVIAVIASVLILLPLLFGLFTLFKGGNPYRILIGIFPAMLSVGFSGNILFGASPLIALSQRNNGVRKRVLGISIPLFTILGRGGSALIASFTIMHLMQSSGTTQLSLQTMILIALFAALFSFGASFTPGMEVLFIVTLVFRGFMTGATTEIQASLLVLLPFIQLAALIVDTAVIAVGSAFSSRIVSPDDRVPIEEMM